MRSSRLLLVAIAALGAIALGAATLLSSHSPDEHLDGAGALGSNGSPGHEALGTDPSTGVRSWTFGVRLCIEPPAESATLVSVGPTRTVGTGFQVLGTSVRAFEETPTHGPIIGVEGFPPSASEVPDRLEPPGGFVVRSTCESRGSGPYTELLVGLGILGGGGGGGGWNGIAVRYMSGGSEHTLQLHHDLLICGSSVSTDPAVADDCSQVRP